MKNTVTKMKNTLQGINSKIDEAEDQSEIWKIRKQKTASQNSKKIEEGGEQKPLGKLQVYQHLHHEDARRRERARN